MTDQRMRGPIAWVFCGLAAVPAIPEFLWREFVVGWEWSNPCTRCGAEAMGDGLCWDCRRAVRNG